MKTKTILIFGLPGSGKTYISKCLLEHLDADHFNADAIRTQHNDWDFSEEGRLRQVHRMKDLCRESEKPFAIMDFVCPFTQGRQILNPDQYLQRGATSGVRNFATSAKPTGPEQTKACVSTLKTN